MTLSFPGAVRVPDTLRTFARSWAGKLKEYNRAQSPARHTMVATIEATPLAADQSPIGEPRGVITRDVSYTGIGFISDHAIDTPFASLKIKSMGEAVLIEILKCEPVGEFFDISGKFLATANAETKPKEELNREHEGHLRHYQQALLKIIENIDYRLTKSGGQAVPMPPQPAIHTEREFVEA